MLRAVAIVVALVGIGFGVGCFKRDAQKVAKNLKG